MMKRHPKMTHVALTFGVLVSGYFAAKGFDTHALVSGLAVNVAWIWSDTL